MAKVFSKKRGRTQSPGLPRTQNCLVATPDHTARKNEVDFIQQHECFFNPAHLIERPGSAYLSLRPAGNARLMLSVEGTGTIE
jgi:hypothetical protein